VDLSGAPLNSPEDRISIQIVDKLEIEGHEYIPILNWFVYD
jgi:hypothetical protein